MDQGRVVTPENSFLLTSEARLTRVSKAGTLMIGSWLFMHSSRNLEKHNRSHHKAIRSTCCRVMNSVQCFLHVFIHSNVF